MQGAKKIKPIGQDQSLIIASLVEEQVALQPDATMIVTGSEEITWLEFYKLSNSFANLMLSRGCKKGDVVPVIMENSIEYLACIVGISRIGVIAALINSDISGAQLLHCLGEVRPIMVLVDEQGANRILDCEDSYREQFGNDVPVLYFGEQKPRKAIDLLQNGGKQLQGVADAIPELVVPVTAGDTALYIYTSGSTGFPKAAAVTHGKFVTGSQNFSILAYRAKPSDRMYVCLPLYHGTGLIIGVGACLHSGCSMFLRKKFSANQWLAEVIKYQCNLFVYVGEICRYLLNTPPSSRDRQCTIKSACGNGIRPDIWNPFKNRFDIKRLCEFYGATESVGGCLNILNKDKTIGMATDEIRLVKYSIDDAKPIRDKNGRLQFCNDGEPGLLLIQAPSEGVVMFKGYVNNRAASEEKLVRDAFTDGDCWFNSGDVLKQVDVGYSCGIPHYQFVDRLGDTYRWKAENVSTIEIAEILCRYDAITLATVYGVTIPGTDGKAGMATITLQGESVNFDLSAFSRYVVENIPNFARPLFIRIKNDFDSTGTHKIMKTKLVEEAYDMNKIDDPIYCMNKNQTHYEALTEQRFGEITAGRSSY